MPTSNAALTEHLQDQWLRQYEMTRPHQPILPKPMKEHGHRDIADAYGCECCNPKKSPLGWNRTVPYEYYGTDKLVYRHDEKGLHIYNPMTNKWYTQEPVRTPEKKEPAFSYKCEICDTDVVGSTQFGKRVKGNIFHDVVELQVCYECQQSFSSNLEPELKLVASPRDMLQFYAGFLGMALVASGIIFSGLWISVVGIIVLGILNCGVRFGR